MKLPTEESITPQQWLNMHIDALFTHDEQQHMLTVNEPWGSDAPAPLFMWGRAADGTAVYRYRHDVPLTMRQALEAMLRQEAAPAHLFAEPAKLEACAALLQANRIERNICYRIPPAPSFSASPVIRVTQGQHHVLQTGFADMIDELAFAQPYVAVVQQNEAVSVCRSVRITPFAHEAGLETLPAARGCGYASAAVAYWAAAVRELGSLPLYSTSWDNHASQRVAAKLGLLPYGVTFAVHQT